MSQIPFDEVRAWMFDAALPFWAERGVDRMHGGFFEELNPDGSPAACAFKRLRVICRQTYVFSHAAVLGWLPGEALSEHGFDFILARARLSDGGWARRFSRHGEVTDPTWDLYDVAYVIFAAAWRYRASGEQRARACALDVLNFVHERMRRPGGGFWETLPAGGERRQNPHMHLTEACLSAFEATHDERFLETACALIDVFRTRFFDGETVGERFDDDWRRVGTEVEPGHHFEWAWILGQFQRLTGENVAHLLRAVTDHAERRGVNVRTHAVYDAIEADGAVVRSSSRIWANAERLKAALALFELTGADPRPAVVSTLRLIFNRYFAGQAPGLWIDKLDIDGAAISRTVPASCLYHLHLAFAELLRLEPDIDAAGLAA